jgi:hypothetical protein
MASVVTVGTCSAKSPYRQNALRKQKHVSYKSNHTAVQKAENSATSQSVIGEKKLVQSREGRITPSNRRFPMDARKAVIGPLAGFRRGRCPIASRRMEAGLPVKVRLVRKSWCAPSGGGLAARVKDTRQTARCRATSQNAFGEKDLAMELQRTIRHDGDSRCLKRRASSSQSRCNR